MGVRVSTVRSKLEHYQLLTGLGAFLLQRESLKYLIHRGFVEMGDAWDLQDYYETAVDFQLLLEDGHEWVNADGDPDLGIDGVLGGSEEGLDP